MYPLIRVDKRVPDGSTWQSRRGYLLPSLDGWARVYQPAGTRWSNPLGGWTAETEGVAIFHPATPYTISCHGGGDGKRFYVDVAYRVRVEPERVEFVDLFLDVMVDAAGSVSEKDEHQLAILPPDLRSFALSARDEVRGLIAAHDRLFDPRSAYYAVPGDATALPPWREALEIA